eukprot:4973903-Ditylum_brightwellii.AAC.1
MEDTDACAKQYRCATTFYLLSMLAVQFDVVIDHDVSAPGHGNDIVDGLNTVDKRFLRSAMFRILFPEEAMNSKNECRKHLQHHADNISSVITEKS